MHYISQFYFRRFGFETRDNPKTEKERQRGIRVYTLNKKAACILPRGMYSSDKEISAKSKCIIERRNPETLCNIDKYNTQEEEPLLSIVERGCSVSVDAIINKNFNSEDIRNIKMLIALFYSNTPSMRQRIGNPLEELMHAPPSVVSDEGLKEIEELIGYPLIDGIKGKLAVSASLAIQLINQLITWDYHLEYISEKENQEFVTSDRPVCSITISQENGLSTHEGWEYSNTNGSTISIPKKVNEIIIPQDMIFYFPIDPKTAIFLYRKRKEKQYIPNFKDYIQDVNWAQFATSDKYIIAKNKTTLKQLYNVINALTS